MKTHFFTLPSLPNYPGGKNGDGTYQTIVNQLPPHRYYIEPFLGGGAILRRKRPAQVSIGLEIDREVFSVWENEAPRREDLRILHRDAFAWFADPENAMYLRDRNTMLMVDAPYLRDQLTRAHCPHMLSDDQHIQLANLLRSLKCNVMVCHLPSLLYENLYQGWRTLQYKNKTRRGTQVEQLWMNYAEPEALHDYSYIGHDFRNRWNLSKTIDRLSTLPKVVQRGIIHRLNERLTA